MTCGHTGGDNEQEIPKKYIVRRLVRDYAKMIRTIPLKMVWDMKMQQTITLF